MIKGKKLTLCVECKNQLTKEEITYLENICNECERKYSYENLEVKTTGASPMQQNRNFQQAQNQQSQLIDRGRVVVAVDQYPEKINGQVQMVAGPNGQQIPKMKNKYMTIGEATKWQQPDGRITESEKIYLKPVNCQNNYYEQRTFWESQDQQNGQQPQQQTGGYRT